MMYYLNSSLLCESEKHTRGRNKLRNRKIKIIFRIYVRLRRKFKKKKIQKTICHTLVLNNEIITISRKINNYGTYA